MEQVIVTIGPDGNPNIEVKGVKGKRCRDVTADLERELGSVNDRKLTSEYLQRGQETKQTQGR